VILMTRRWRVKVDHSVQGAQRLRKHVAEKLYVSWALLLLVGAAIGSSLQDPRERFEVVSIRPSGPDRNLPTGARGGRVPLPVPLGSYCDGDVPQVNPGRIVLNSNLYTLITVAYSLDCQSPNGSALVSGGPEWVKTDQWAIQALIPAAAGVQAST